MDNKDNYSLDDLFDAWQLQSDRIDHLVKENPVTVDMINRHSWRLSSHRRMLLTSATRLVVCIASLVWLICLFNRYVVDTLDLIPYIIIGCILIYDVVSSLRMVVLLLRHSVATTPPSEMLRMAKREIGLAMPTRPSLPKVQFSIFNVQYSRVATLAAIVAILLVAATPAYDGRSMSVRGMDDRAKLLASSNHIIENIVNASVQ
ncbi:MAG: hypothetical protein IJ745_00340 [Bacteroidales bacterium]|nr:hypothetical protein [Bacteroidales bacterium]